MIFCNANLISAESIKKVLHTYEMASGQMVNYQKSSIVFSKNTRSSTIEQIISVLPMEVVDKHEKYLGLPSVIGKSKREVFANIRDKVCTRLQGWQEKWLSKGGKEILIKSVVQAIPTYAMSCFKLPVYFTKEIERLMAKFWWTSTQGRGMHWAKWRDLCKSKQFGGLGFRDLEAFNTALLAKQLWRLSEKPQSLLSRIFKARYFPNTNLFESTLGSNPSFTWRSIWGAKKLLEKGIRWRIGNGRSVNVWDDKWIPRESTFKVFSPRGNFPADMKVSELIDTDLGSWNIGLINEIFDEEDSKAILSIPLGSYRNEDCLLWHYNQNGLFSVRSAYHLAIKIERNSEESIGGSSSGSVAENWSWLWKINLPSKIKIFLWRACKNLLPTRTNLWKRKIIEVDRCVLCNEGGETTMHVLSYCHLARQTWALSGIPWSVHQWTGEDLKSWILDMRRKTDTKTFEICILICWSIWHSRNKLFFEGKETAAPEIVRFVLKFWDDFHKATTSVMQPMTFRNRANTKWCPPPINVIKINFDASVNKEIGCCGLGAVARNSNGDCLGWSSICIKQPLDPASAEAKAALMAVLFAKEKGWAKVLIEGDSSIVIDAIEGISESRAVFGPIVDDIKYVKETFDSFSARHIWREGNRVAHEVAKLSSHDSFTSDVLPVSILTCITSEQVY